MKAGDRWLQRWRIRKAGAHIPPGSRVLDVGCSEGELFRILGPRVASGLGVDPHVARAQEEGNVRLVPGAFPADVADDAGPFDAITMLAVIEHIPRAEHATLAATCARLLRPGGWVIVTAPSPLVDRILDVLMRLRILDGMDTEQHFGFGPRETIDTFVGHGFILQHRSRFQLGLNNLFVFRLDTPAPSARSGDGPPRAS